MEAFQQAVIQRQLVTMSETHVQHVTPEKNSQCSTCPSADKLRVFRFAIILIVYLQKGKTMNGNYYTKLLQRLSIAYLDKNNGLFHQDINILAYTSTRTTVPTGKVLETSLMTASGYCPPPFSSKVVKTNDEQLCRQRRSALSLLVE